MWLALSGFASATNVMILLVLCVLFTGLMLGKPVGQAQLNEESGGRGIIDSTFNYSAERAYGILEALGASGRKAYERFLLLDAIYILVYKSFLAVAIAFGARTLLPLGSLLARLSVVPLIAGLADYAEDICIALMLSSYPMPLTIIAHASNYMTMIKLILAGISLVLALPGVVKAVMVMFHVG